MRVLQHMVGLNSPACAQKLLLDPVETAHVHQVLLLLLLQEPGPGAGGVPDRALPL
jgi:hypothetical protein